MQDRSTQFARANNLGGLGIYGDPERWGATFTATIATDSSAFSEQLIRAQCADLYATAWDLMLTWEQTGGNALDPDVHLFSCGVGLTIGLGITTTDLSWIAMRNNQRIAASTDLGISGGGTFNLGNPYRGAALLTIPANAIAGKVAIGLEGGQNVSGSWSVSLMCAPRVGVR